MKNGMTYSYNHGAVAAQTKSTAKNTLPEAACRGPARGFAKVLHLFGADRGSRARSRGFALLSVRGPISGFVGRLSAAA